MKTTARRIKMARVEVKRTWAGFIAAVAAHQATTEIKPGDMAALAAHDAAAEARWAADARHTNAQRRLRSLLK